MGLALQDAVPDPPRLPPPWSRLAFGLLLLASAALRLWFASVDLNDARYWDEHYAVRNLRAVLVDGSLEPVSYYYQSLSYLPQAALLAAVEGAVHLAGHPDYSFFDGRTFKPEGYLLCRLTVVALSLLSLWLLFRLGCRLASPEVGLVAALLLAASPLHLRLSTDFKPDMLVLALTLLTLGWSVSALEEPGWLRCLLAGAGVGLVMSAKLTGATSAVPLAAGALAAGLRDRRHWLRLPAAGLAACAVFLLLNPQLGRYRDAFLHNLDLYAARGETGDGGRSTFEEIANFSIPEGVDGQILKVAVVAGLVAVFGLALWRWWRRRPGALAGLALLSYPAGFVLLYGAFSSYAKANNFLPVLGFLALGAAGGGVALGRAVCRPLPLPVRRLAGIAAVSALAAFTLSSALDYAYVVLVPSTWERALGLVDAELSPPSRRLALLEDPPELHDGAVGHQMHRRVEDLERLDPAELSGSDAEVFASDRLLAEWSFYSRRIAPRDGVRVRLVRPRLFRARGEPLVVILHPAEQVVEEKVAPITVAASPGVFVLLPVHLEGGESLSIEIRLPHGSDPPSLLLARQEQPLRHFREGSLDVWESDRFRPPRETAYVANLRLPEEAQPGEAEVWISRWMRPRLAAGGP